MLSERAGNSRRDRAGKGQAVRRVMKKSLKVPPCILGGHSLLFILTDAAPHDRVESDSSD